MTIGVGFIGYGGIAGWHKTALDNCQDLGKIVGGADINAEQQKKFQEETKSPTFVDYREMLDKTKPQAVVVCTPPSVRLDIVNECLDRGIAMLFEKPLAHTVESAQQIVEKVNKSDIVCATGFCHRFNPGINRIKELFTDGTLGEPIEFINYFVFSSPQSRESWRTDINISGGGCLIDNGNHSVDIFRYLFGSIRNVSGATRHIWPGRGDDTGFMLLASESNVIGQITVSFTYPYRVATIEVVGSKGAAKYDYTNIEELKICTEQDNWQVEKLPPCTRFTGQMKAFLNAIAQGSDSQLASVEDGLIAVEVINKVYKNGL